MKFTDLIFEIVEIGPKGTVRIDYGFKMCGWKDKP